MSLQPVLLESLLLISLLLLMLTLVAGLVRALRGPGLEDRMLSVLLVGTGGVAILMLLSLVLDMPALRDVALLLALLAAVAASALTRREVKHD